MNPVSREYGTGYANTPRRPFPPLDTPQPRHPPQQVTPKGGKGTLGGSCCCGPSLPCFASLWQKTLAAMIKGDCVQRPQWAQAYPVLFVLPIFSFDSPPTRQSVTDCGLYPSRTQDAARACAGLPPIRPQGLPER